MSWNRTCWAEASSCVHCLGWRGPINGQMHSLRAVGIERHRCPLEEQEGMAGLVFHPPSMSWHTAPWLWDRGPVCTDRQTGEKGPPQSQHS